MDPQRRQVRPACGQTHPVVTEDRPWRVTIAENHHDPTSYILCVQTHTRNLTLTRAVREIIELHHQLLDTYPAIPHPAFPIHSASVQPAKQISSTRPTNHESHIKVTIEESVSANSTNTALAWYLTALSNDPVFRQVPQWKNFVRVRAGDLESAPVNTITSATERPNFSDSEIERGPRATSSAEGDSSFNIPYEHHITRKCPTSVTQTTNVLSKVQVSDFEMVCVLGIGSRGKVLLAHDSSSSELYALKVIAKRRVLASQEVQRTLTEQAVLRRMAIEGINPFVVKLRRSFYDEDHLYLVMDFYPGGDLRMQLDRCGSFSHDRSLFYAAEIVDGIEALHAAGVIHRNLKPEHILIDKDGHIVLCGFGKSKAFQRDITQSVPSGNPSAGDTTSSLCGTATYFAPEVIMGLPYSYEIDWWSLGTILYEMLMGFRPFEADNMSEMYDRILKDELQFPEDQLIDRYAMDFIQGLLQRDPALRLSEPRIKRHPYFLMIDWSDVHYLGCKPPYIPPMESSNLGDMQNFEEDFLNMKPVIDDEISVDMEQNQERGQADLDRIRSGGDPFATHSQPRISPDYLSNNDVDVFERYSFNDRHPIVTVEEERVPGEEKPEGVGQDGEVDPENAPGNNSLTEWTILVGETLQLPTPPIHPRLPEPPPTYSNADMAPLPNSTLLAIPDILTQVPAPPPTLPTDVCADAGAAAFARHHHLDQHQSFKPKEPDHLLTDDRNEDDADNTRGEGSDNCPWKFLNIDGGNHDGPRSIKKTVSKYSFSTTRSLASLRTDSSKKYQYP